MDTTRESKFHFFLNQKEKSNLIDTTKKKR